MKDTNKYMSEEQRTRPATPHFLDAAETTDYTWLYVRIYCDKSDADDMLLDLIAPLEKMLLAEGLIAQCFFIRFFEGGHHLRVRFYGQTSVLFGTVDVIVDQHINAYFASKGSMLNAPLDRGPESMDDQTWHPLLSADILRPVPSYEYDRYVREFSRYGGVEGLSISEHHFSSSSSVALQALALEKKGAGTRRNAVLLLLHTLSEEFQLDNQQKAASFEMQYLYHFSHAWRTPPDAALLTQEYERQSLKLHLLLQSDDQIPLHRSRAVWLPLVAAWQLSVSVTYHDLLALQTQNVLQRPLITIFPSYVHMLCNRLGLFPRAEAYLCYLLSCHYKEQSEVDSVSVRPATEIS